MHMALAMLAVLQVIGCTDKKTIDPDVEGFWRVDKIEYLQEEEVKPFARLYWSMQLSVGELNDYGQNGLGRFLFRYEYDEKGKTLRLYNINGKSELSLQEKERLKGFGVFDADETFKVEKSDGNHMVLASDGARIWFTSF